MNTVAKSVQGPLTDPAQVDLLHHRWRGITCALVDALPLAGVHERDVAVTGTPAVVLLGHWGDITLIETKAGPLAAVRARTPTAATFTIDLNSPDDEVVADIVDAVACLMRRRKRHHDDDRAAMEVELVEMVTLTGWASTGIISGQNPAADFHDHHDAIRGRITRSDLHAEDPAGATFAIGVQVSGLRYAEALRALVTLRKAMDEPGSPIGPLAGPAPDETGSLCPVG